MAELYYTNISDRQARLLFAYAEANLLNITPNMSRYIMSLAKQGRGYATDPHEEEVRKHVRSYNQTKCDLFPRTGGRTGDEFRIDH